MMPSRDATTGPASRSSEPNESGRSGVVSPGHGSGLQLCKREGGLGEGGAAGKPAAVVPPRNSVRSVRLPLGPRPLTQAQPQQRLSPLMTNPLFRPFTINGLDPAQPHRHGADDAQLSPGGVPGDDVADYYRRRAAGGVGPDRHRRHRASTAAAPPMTRRCPTFTARALRAGPRCRRRRARRRRPDRAAALARRRAAQPSQPRSRSRPRSPFGPLHARQDQSATAMSDSDVADAIAAFARAAADAKRLGFDAVELHGAHGYLIDQFFWAGTNARDRPLGRRDDRRARRASPSKS